MAFERTVFIAGWHCMHRLYFDRWILMIVESIEASFSIGALNKHSRSAWQACKAFMSFTWLTIVFLASL